MEKMRNAGLMIMCAVAFALAGCTTISGRMYELGPETHFVYPNSNVKMLGPVNYTYKSPRSLGIPKISMTGKEELKFYNAALAQVPGSNLITDYVRIITFKSLIIYPPLMFYWTEFTIQGTAAKMTVGEQEIEGETGAGRPEAKAPAEKLMREAEEISKAAKMKKAAVEAPAGKAKSAPPVKMEQP
jgi:hypothetical protein